jgi:uncharacterized coiled-coil protein SlyX
VLWGALGSGAFQSEADESTRAEVQQKIRELNASIAETKAKLFQVRAQLITQRRRLHDVQESLLAEYAAMKNQKRDEWSRNRERLIEEARKTYDANYRKRLKEWEEAAEAARGQPPGGVPQVAAAGASSLYGPSSPTAQAASNLAALGSKPVYRFEPPDDLPEAPRFDDDLIYLGSKDAYTDVKEKIDELSESETDLEESITRWIENSSRLMEKYLAVYPGALVRFENDSGQEGGINIDDVIRRNLLGQFGRGTNILDLGDEIDLLLSDARENWRNLAPPNRLLEIFSANPTRFFEINNKEISQQINATTFRTGHIVLFLAANVFHVQNEALKLFPTGEETYPICESEPIRKARGPWPRLPDYKDPECLRALVEGIAESPEAKQAMADSLFGLFGAKTELFKKNIPALQSRLGGAPIFFPPPGSKDYGNFVEFELENVRSAVANAASLYEAEGFKPPLVVFTDRLKQKLYQDRVDANAGYRGMQNVIGSVVFEAVYNEVIINLLTSFRERPIGDGDQKTVRKRLPSLPKDQIVFDYDPASNEVAVLFDKSKKIQRRVPARFVTEDEAVGLRSAVNKDFANRLSALWLAGEVSLTSLLFESLPGVDISFAVDALGVQERSKQQIPEWTLDGLVTNWPAEADNILAHFAGSATMIVVAPYVSVLPESQARYAAAETLIANLHKKLRAEALQVPGPESAQEKIDNAKALLSRIGNGYLLGHPVYKFLLNYLQAAELSPSQIAEVKKSALGYMVQYALEHQALVEFVARRFLDVVEDASGIRNLGPSDVKEALLAANDLVASTNILPLTLLNKLQSTTEGVKLGVYDRTSVLEDHRGMRSDATQVDVAQRGLQWSSLNPMNIFDKMNRSLSVLSKRISEESGTPPAQ